MILCCGEALVDMIPAPSADEAGHSLPRPGGAALNSAMVLGKMGVSVGLFAGLSQDGPGRMLTTELSAAGVDVSMCPVSDRHTAQAFVTLGGDEAAFTFTDDGSAGRMLSPADLPELPDQVSACLFGGISLCHPPAADAYETLAAREAGRRLIMLDPNIRPTLLGDEATYRARLARMIALSDIVKLSLADLDWLAPGEATPQDRARAVLAEGPALILLTRGAAGAVALRHGAPDICVAAEPVTVSDTVGAGDAFNAGVLARLDRTGVLNREGLTRLDDENLREVLSSGARAAAKALSRS